MIAGRVEELYFEEGDSVSAGEIIARLESAVIEAQLRQAEASLEVARANYLEAEANLADAELNLTRNSELFNEGAISQAQLDSVKTRYDLAKARYKAQEARGYQAEASIDYIKAQMANNIIYAPISGSVLKKFVEVGEMLLPRVGPMGLPGFAVLILADMSVMKVEVDINETDIGLVKLGQIVTIVPDAAPGKEYKGRVMEISPQADRQKSVIQVTIRIINPDPVLKPDMSVKVNFVREAKELKKRKAIFIPEEAVIKSNNNKGIIFVIKNERAYMQEVKTGKTMRREVEITGGIEGNEEIVVKGHELLKDRDKVRVKR